MRLTRDQPAPGLVVYQPARGFRYGAEAFWLAGFALEQPARRVADLGTGSGIIALLLARAGLECTGFDSEPRWASCWERTLAESSVGCALVQADVAGELPGSFDLVVSNPPFSAVGTGPVSPDPLKRAARTESTATLARFLEVAAALAPRRCFVLPVERQAEAEEVAGPANRRVWVGSRRVLLEWGGPEREDTRLGEDHTRVRGWYTTLRSG